MTRAPGPAGDDPEPEGGRAAERLRQMMLERFGTTARPGPPEADDADDADGGADDADGGDVSPLRAPFERPAVERPAAERPAAAGDDDTERAPER